jgi:hypothetical protein
VEPATIAIRAVPPANLDLLRNFPGLKYADHTVTFVAPSFTPEGFLQMIAVIEVAAALGRSELLAEMLEGDPKTKGTMAKLEERYFLRWLDVESGRWKPPESR